MPPFAVASAVDWRQKLRRLNDGCVLLRELKASDAASLLRHLNTDSVKEYVAACPSTEEKFRRFIRWTHRERRRGSLACYGIVPSGSRDVVGVIQVWPVERDFFTAEWGFAVGAAFWGTGLFVRAASLAIDAAFTDLGVHRLEARAAVLNRRGNAALEKLGARREGLLRESFRHGDTIGDHVMWSILAPEWRARRPSHAS